MLNNNAILFEHIFNNCKTIEELCGYYVEAKKQLDKHFKQRLTEIVCAQEKGGVQE